VAVDKNLFVISQNLVCAQYNLFDHNLTTERQVGAQSSKPEFLLFLQEIFLDNP